MFDPNLHMVPLDVSPGESSVAAWAVLADRNTLILLQKLREVFYLGEVTTENLGYLDRPLL